MQRATIRDVRTSVVKVLEAKAGEKDPDVLLHFQAALGGGGVINENLHLYDAADYKAAVERANTRILEVGRLVGQDGHPAPGAETYGNASVVWTRFWTEDRDGWVESMGEGIVPDNSKGRDLAPLMRLGVAIAFSSRASAIKEERVMDERDPHFKANTSKKGKQYLYLTETEIETWDPVVTPGFDSARVRAYHEAVQAGVSFDEYVAATINKQLEDRMSLEKRIAELEKERDALKADLDGKLEAKAKEVRESVTAEFAAKLTEQAKGLPTAEQRALLERLAKLPADKLEAAIKALETGSGEASVSEAKAREVALETRIMKQEGDIRGLQDMLRKRDEDASREKAKSLVREHVTRVTAKLLNGEKIAELLNGDEALDTVEKVDARLKFIKDVGGLTEITEGLTPGSGKPAGHAAATDTYRPSSESKGADIAEAEMEAIRLVAGGRRAKASA